MKINVSILVIGGRGMQKKWISTAEMAWALDISPHTLQMWRNRGCKIGQRLGRTHYYEPADRERLLEWRRTQLKPRGRPRKVKE